MTYANGISSTIISGDGSYMFYCHFNNETACEIILILTHLAYIVHAIKR